MQYVHIAFVFDIRIRIREEDFTWTHEMITMTSDDGAEVWVLWGDSLNDGNLYSETHLSVADSLI